MQSIEVDESCQPRIFSPGNESSPKQQGFSPVGAHPPDTPSPLEKHALLAAVESLASYQGTALAGPLRTKKRWALAPATCTASSSNANVETVENAKLTEFNAIEWS
jgi:hypothetical protein